MPVVISMKQDWAMLLSKTFVPMTFYIHPIWISFLSFFYDKDPEAQRSQIVAQGHQ